MFTMMLLCVLCNPPGPLIKGQGQGHTYVAGSTFCPWACLFFHFIKIKKINELMDESYDTPTNYQASSKTIASV